MISRWEWVLRQFTRRLWFRASLYGIAAVVTALVAALVGPMIPDDLSSAVGADAVEDILTIIASSMLAVATFSLSTMVAAYAAAASTATPRATILLIDDSTAQNALAVFVGAFLFSLVGIIALSTGFYSAGDRLVLFVVTLALVVGIVLTLFRWIDYLSRLGRLGETVGKVEEAAKQALQERWASPHIGCEPLISIPPTARPVSGRRIGYIQHLDVEGLSRVAEETGAAIYVARLPGAFVDGQEPLAWSSEPLDERCRERVVEAFLVGPTRSFEQDPRFGLVVMAEIASHALSPSINDPGTAIDVIGRLVRVLSICSDEPDEEATQVQCSRVYVPALSMADLFDDAFTAIARDGAGMVEIGIRLQKAFGSLSRLGCPSLRIQAQRHAALSLKRAEDALGLAEDRDQIAAVAAATLEPITLAQPAPANVGAGRR